MEALASLLSFELYLIVCCLFAPIDNSTFEIELREGQRAKGVVWYAQRTEQGFSIYGTKERTGDSMVIRRIGDRYILLEGKDGNESEFAIDNSKVGIKPLNDEGIYSKTIDGCEVNFEFDKDTRKVYQKNTNKLFIIR